MDQHFGQSYGIGLHGPLPKPTLVVAHDTLNAAADATYNPNVGKLKTAQLYVIGIGMTALGVVELVPDASLITRPVAKAAEGMAERVVGREVGTQVAEQLTVKAEVRAAETTVAPRFLVTESGVAVPTEAAELQANMKLLQETSTSPATARKFLGTDSQGPLRVRIEQAHPSTPGYTGPIDPLHTVDHLHIDRRLNGTTGPWQSNEKLPYGWPF